LSKRIDFTAPCMLQLLSYMSNEAFLCRTNDPFSNIEFKCL
jgi:hypothetical protein